jgi:CheY-like chemotaxis protein
MSMDRPKDELPPRDGSPTSHGTDVIEGLRVLYAEDHPAMQRAVGRLLTAAGASVTIANDGLEATEAALATSFDLILMDLRMPRMNGFEAARALRAAGCRVALVAVTADASPAVRANGLAAGFDAVLQKPFELSDLIPALQLGRERQKAQRRESDSR